MLLSQRNLVGIGLAVAATLQAGEEDAWWVAAPWRSAFARTAGVAAAWLSGGELVLAAASDEPIETLWRARPSIVVAGSAVAESLARRAVSEVERGVGMSGRLACWAFHQALRPSRASLPGHLRSALADALGGAGLREVTGGRLSRMLIGDGVPGEEAPRHLQALGIRAWAATGNDRTAGVVTLQELPSTAGGATTVPGTRTRTAADGELWVEGVSAANPLHRGASTPPPAADGFRASGLRRTLDR